MIRNNSSESKLQEIYMIKPFITAAGAALIAMTMVPATASASSPGFVTTNLNVRAGPGTQFPAVAVFPAGSRVNVIGCTRGFGWCDVSARGIRGWVSGSFLEVAHQNRRVRAPSFGAQIGLPIISFQIGNYWDNHYRGRSWYDQRSRFGGSPARIAPRQEQAAPVRVAPRQFAPPQVAPEPTREYRREERRGDGRRGDRWEDRRGDRR
jgi:uncharacterized protein YraI